MKKKRLNKIVLLVLLICIILGSVLGIEYFQDLKEKGRHYVSREEMIHYLSFAYDTNEYKNILEQNVENQISWSDIGFILKMLGITDYIDTTSMDLTSNKKIKKEEWSDIYFNIVDILDTEKTVNKLRIIVLDQEDSEKKTNIITDQGTYVYWDKNYFEKYGVYEVAIKGNEILGSFFDIEKETILSNVWLNQTNKEISIMLGEKEITFDKISLAGDDIKGICDIYFENSKIKKIIQKKDVIKGKLLSYNEKQIEVEGYGTIPCEDVFRLYQTYDNIIEKEKNEMVVGDDWIEFVVANGKISAGLITQPANMEMIRVLLLNNAGGTEQDKIELTSTDPFYVIVNDQNIKYEANELFELNKESNLFNSGSLRIESGATDGRIIVNSLKRSSGTPSYDGKLEIRKNENGLVLVNEITMEKYLYGVLPSEMPKSFGTEALKVQAVCARSFAYCQILKNNYSSYGAHVDDSTNCQVYNNLETNKESIEAVDDTKGLVVSYQENVVETYYFSCSSGHTTDFTAWGQEEDDDHKYLKGVFVGNSIDSKLDSDLSSEENFKKFIEATDEDWYDQEGNWFRWNCEMLNDDITNKINTKILERYKINPTLIQAYEGNKEVSIDKIRNLNEIQSIEVSKRNKNGNVLELTIKENGINIKIKSEYNIRTILGPSIKTAINKNNEEIEINGLLPSAFFNIKPNYDGNEKLIGWKFNGGGHGHGIGLSQTACKNMAEKGMKFEEILNYFYNDIELKDMYKEE